ncbi:MAG TPA: type II secretion system protein [Peptostreptococcaceae bacterium]|nr:type II secretion system protein [Peptostreptococcaceae bacterium]
MKIKNRKVKRGFTLIELVMVVGILGILSSVALVKFTDVQANAKVNADYVAASNIANAAKLAKEAGVAVTNLESLKTAGYLEGIVEPQSVEGTFIIAPVDGSFKVMVGTTQFYPKPVSTQTAQ